MKCDCFDGDVQNMGHLLCGPAFGDELQNLPFPRAEVKSSRREGRIPESLQMLARKTWSYIDAATQDVLYSIQKLFARGGFQYVSRPSCVERGFQVRRVNVH